jgi:hypothetical protein
VRCTAINESANGFARTLMCAALWSAATCPDVYPQFTMAAPRQGSQPLARGRQTPRSPTEAAPIPEGSQRRPVHGPSRPGNALAFAFGCLRCAPALRGCLPPPRYWLRPLAGSPEALRKLERMPEIATGDEDSTGAAASEEHRKGGREVALCSTGRAACTAGRSATSRSGPNQAVFEKQVFGPDGARQQSPGPATRGTQPRALGGKCSAQKVQPCKGGATQPAQGYGLGGLQGDEVSGVQFRCGILKPET